MPLKLGLFHRMLHWNSGYFFYPEFFSVKRNDIVLFAAGKGFPDRGGRRNGIVSLTIELQAAGAYGDEEVSLIGDDKAAGFGGFAAFVSVDQAEGMFELLCFMELRLIEGNFLLHHFASGFILVARTAFRVVLRCFFGLLDDLLRGFDTLLGVFGTEMVELLF